ncbi:PqqD family protein [candidate division KSB1 bacterium]|nr:PqqD family protein [candidate division KSB1 bacterium]
MASTINMESIYVPSDKIVARDIDGELVIVPLASGVGDSDDELFTLNETGRDIWDRLDGTKNLNQVAQELSSDYDHSVDEIKIDVKNLVQELLTRQIVKTAN